MHRMSALAAAVIAVAIAGWNPSPAYPRQIVKIHVGFSPDVAEASTTILFGFTVTTPDGQVPSPATDIDLELPQGVGLGNLGLSTCTTLALEVGGREGCSPNALMGVGTAWVEVPIGEEPLVEEVKMTTFMGPPVEEHTALLFYAQGFTPVAATQIFFGQLLPSSGVYGAHLNTVVPIQPSVPGAPDVAVVRYESTLGPKDISYFRWKHGERVWYEPEGMTIPPKCPRGGFPFAAKFTFQDGSTVVAKSIAPCPRDPAQRRKSH
jgi:hypothetical protein